MNENDLVVSGSIYFQNRKKKKIIYSQQSTYRSLEWKEVSHGKEIGLFFSVSTMIACINPKFDALTQNPGQSWAGIDPLKEQLHSRITLL